jgi:carboxypeptidase D
VVIIAASLWGWWVWRGRRRERQRGYMSVPLSNGHGPLETFRSKRGTEDVEAGDFDENELDNVKSRRTVNGNSGQLEDEHYSLGSDSDEDADDGQPRNPKGVDGGEGRS